MIGGVNAILAGQSERAQAPAVTVRRLLGELAPHRRALAGASALVLLASGAQALGPWLVGRAIDKNIVHGDGRGLLVTLACMLVAYVGGALAQRAQVYLIGSTGQRVLAALRQRLFERFQALPIGFFDRRPLGDLMSRATSDVDALNMLLMQGLTQSIGAVVGLVVSLGAMLALNPPLAGVTFLVIPVLLLTIRGLAAAARPAYRRTRETTGAVMAGLQEEIVGVREAQAFNRTEENVARFRERNAANRDASIAVAALTSAFSPAVDALGTLTTAAVLAVGAWQVLHGTLTIGVLAAFTLYVAQFFWPIQLVAQVSAQAQAALAGAERIYGILDEPVESETGAGAPPAGPGRIEYRSVGFAYRPDVPVLDDVSFEAEPGRTVAIVGPTGAGKTTLVNLLPRFYDATAGRILLDGADIRHMPRAALRGRIAVVSQEPFLFGGTVAENLAYGRPEASRAEIEAMAKAVGAHDFIAELPQGYDTPLGEGAGRLGHGQRQLLAIARAMLADRPILILDEATSHVDTATEAALQRALETLMRGRTTLVIAHRLSTIRHADLILVVDAGRVVERGTHDALVAEGGLYARLHRHHEAASGR